MAPWAVPLSLLACFLAVKWAYLYYFTQSESAVRLEWHHWCEGICKLKRAMHCCCHTGISYLITLKHSRYFSFWTSGGFYCSKELTLTAVQLLCTVMLLAAVQQSESAVRMHVCLISFPFGSHRAPCWSSLSCTVGSHQLPILCTVVHLLLVPLSQFLVFTLEILFLGLDHMVFSFLISLCLICILFFLLCTVLSHRFHKIMCSPPPSHMNVLSDT